MIRVILSILLAVVLTGACSGTPGPAGPGATASQLPGQPTTPAAVSTGFVPGGWSGTITVNAVISSDTTETSNSGEPGGVYYTTTTTHAVTQAEATDEITVTGNDDSEDVIYGIGSVELTGPASNSGMSHELYVSITDKHNALGCHYTDEVGSDVTGSWSLNGHGRGEIRFSDDGSYTITISASQADPVTGEYETTTLPEKLWETYTIIEGAARDCPPTGRSEVVDANGGLLEWANTLARDVNIKGSIDPANPPSVVDGSITADTTLPEATVTVTWHLVHDGPIVVTPQEPPPEE